MSPGPAIDFPTPDEVRAIADQPDGALRNRWITWSYYRLNRAMQAIVGDSDLTWCGFATWASKTAGTFIREEELGPLLERWVDGATRRAGTVPALVARMVGVHHGSSDFSLRGFVREVVADVADDIAGGNQDVFRHIAPPFAQALVLWTGNGGSIPDGQRQAFLESLRERESADPGQYLLRAFAAMFGTAETTDARARAQLMLQANALIGCAEQTRVQPFIERSMNRPIADLFHARLGVHLRSRFPAPIASVLRVLLRPLGKALEIEFQSVSTELLMRLDLPGQALRLGANVPCLPDGRMYPAALETLDAPLPTELLAELHALDAMASAARDWVRYADRMRYIGVLFRSRQQQRELWDAPFTGGEVTELKEGAEGGHGGSRNGGGGDLKM
jgi:hypothetical protein